MKQALSFLPALLLLVSAFHAFLIPEKFNIILAISAIVFIAQQVLNKLEQPDLAKELKDLETRSSQEIADLRLRNTKEMADLRDDFAKASMIISNKAAANPVAPKSKQMMF